MRTIGMIPLFIVGVTTFSMPAHALLQWGKPACIVVGKDAPQEEAFAAREFQRLYKVRTGEELPITNEEGSENAVYVGRAALNIERKQIIHILPDGSRRALPTPGNRESSMERVLGFDFDTLPKEDFVYRLTGWAGTFEMHIAGATPHATLEAVYDFCEKNLDTKRDADKDALAHLSPFRGWSLDNFIQKPDIDAQWRKKESKLQSPAAVAQTSNDSQNPKANPKK